jgi:hypothetical protein
MGENVMANIPEGFVLDKPVGAIPPGFTLDSVPEKEPQGQGNILQRTGKLALDMGRNLPKSSFDLLNNMGLALMHPLDSAQALGEIAFGGVEKLVPGKQPHEQQFSKVADFFKSRYGSLENLNKTIASDPAGVMADMSALLTGVGGATKMVGGLAEMPGLAGAGATMVKAGAMADPVNLAVTGAAKLTKGAPEAMYASASKMGTTKGMPERRAAVGKALDEGLMPTEAGLGVLKDKKNILYTKLNQIIDGATEAGGTIPRDKLFSNMREAVDTAAAGPNSATVKKQIFNMMGQLRKEWPKVITPRNAQDIKVSFQRAVKEANYGHVTPGVKDAQKQVARSARQLLEEKYPEVRGINKELAEYKNLEAELEKAANRIGNRDPMGMTKMLFTGFGGAAAGSEGMAAGLGLGLLLDPRVQSKLAILLKSLQKKGLNRNPKIYAGREAARQAGQMREDNPQQEKQP